MRRKGGRGMSEWKKVKLGEVCDTQYGFTTSTVQQDTGTQFLRITDIVPQLIDWNTVPYCQIQEKDREKYLLHKGDIVVARTGATVGYAKYIKEDVPAVFASYLVRLLVNSIDVDRHYVGLCVESNLFKEYIQSISNGSAQPNANAQMISSFEINLPPLSTQHRIATILSRYDSLIENYQKQIKLLEEAAQRLYKEWFVDLRFSGHENTKIVDGVPEGWEKKKISDICQTVGGGTPSTKVAEYYDDGNIKWVTPTDITRSNCLCLFDTDKKITEDGLAHSSAKILPPETILMTSRASVGYFGIYDCEVCTNQGFISCIPNERSYQMYMLYNLMNRVEEIRQKAGGSTYLEISKSVFRDFDIVLPSCMVLETFQEQSHKMLDCMRQIAKQLRLLTEARDRLLPKLMSGEITV